MLRFLVLGLFVIGCIFGCGGDSGGHTAQCNDGTYSDSTNCSGTCSSHGGVSTWYISNCGNSKTLTAIMSKSSGIGYGLTNGTWSGQVKWHTNGQVQLGTLKLVLQDEKVMMGTYESSNGVESAKVTGEISNGFLKLNYGESTTYEISGDIEILQPNQLSGFYDLYQIAANVKNEEGILELDLERNYLTN